MTSVYDPCAVRQLAGHPKKVAEMGESARVLWAERFRRERALEAWQNVRSGREPHTDP
jgi:hypothetical protein